MAIILLATDADWILDEVEAALVDDRLSVSRVRRGVDVVPAIVELQPALVMLDLQIGNMGGMAACVGIRHEQGMDRIGPLPVLMLLDRAADVFLAQRSQADGWLIKPLDAFRIRRATEALLAGYGYVEGVDPAEVDPDDDQDEPAADPAAEAVGG